MVNGNGTGAGAVIALIPARGGSKGIPRKNIRALNGYPLIAYAIAAAREARRCDRVIVSTDDEEIAAVARAWGAEVPFLRPAELAGDETPDLPVFLHALDWLRAQGQPLPQAVVQVRPTSPLRPPGCIDGAIDLLLADSGADAVRAVTPAGQTPYKMWWIAQDRMIPLLQSDLPEAYNLPRQKLPAVYWQTGHVEAIRTRTLLEKHSMSGDELRPYLVDPAYAIDLDTPAQWVLAEQWLRSAGWPCIDPGRLRQRPWADLRLLVTDFDGVMTDNRVHVTQDGREVVTCSRGDGWGLARLREAGVPVVVLSSETNPVVAERCRKLGLSVRQGIADKGVTLRELAAEHGCDLEHTAYVANDLNDLPALEAAGLRVAVADAHPEVRARAHLILSRRGGQGALRELSDMVLEQRGGNGHAR